MILWPGAAILWAGPAAPWAGQHLCGPEQQLWRQLEPIPGASKRSQALPGAPRSSQELPEAARSWKKRCLAGFRGRLWGGPEGPE